MTFKMPEPAYANVGNEHLYTATQLKEAYNAGLEDAIDKLEKHATNYVSSGSVGWTYQSAANIVRSIKDKL